MSRFGLIGFPIAHSLSPRLFKAAYGGRFRYDLLEYEDFDTAFRLFMKSYDAVNITAPFKEFAFDKAKLRSEHTREDHKGAQLLQLRLHGGQDTARKLQLQRHRKRAAPECSRGRMRRCRHGSGCRRIHART